MTSPRRANSLSSASAGGQEEHPCEVNNSTTVGRVSASAGEAVNSRDSHNNTAAHPSRCNGKEASHLRTHPKIVSHRGGRAIRVDHICVQPPPYGGGAENISISLGSFRVRVDRPPVYPSS